MVLSACVGGVSIKFRLFHDQFTVPGTFKMSVIWSHSLDSCWGKWVRTFWTTSVKKTSKTTIGWNLKIHTLSSDCTENVSKLSWRNLLSTRCFSSVLFSKVYYDINHIFCAGERIKFGFGFRIKYNWSTSVYRQYTITCTNSEPN